MIGTIITIIGVVVGLIAIGLIIAALFLLIQVNLMKRKVKKAIENGLAAIDSLG